MLRDSSFLLLFIIRDPYEIWKIGHQCEARSLPGGMDKRLRRVVAPTIEHLNMSLPEDGTDVCRNA